MLRMTTTTPSIARRSTTPPAARIDVRFDAPLARLRAAEALRRTLRAVLDRAVAKIVVPRHAVAIDVLVTDDAEIRRLNALHRRIDRATDVLSFPQFEPAELRFLWGVDPPACFKGSTRRRGRDETREAVPGLPGRHPIHLGDIVVSLPMIERQALRRDTTLQEELEFVVAHALLHLLGCDHDTPARRRAMWEFTHLLIWNGPHA